MSYTAFLRVIPKHLRNEMIPTCKYSKLGYSSGKNTQIRLLRHFTYSISNYNTGTMNCKFPFRKSYEATIWHESF